ncbi:hypothetical protein [Pseudoalteromonas rubra]|nr:hypothetical protein [Pseudoalteromonas rubra]
MIKVISSSSLKKVVGGIGGGTSSPGLTRKQQLEYPEQPANTQKP